MNWTMRFPCFVIIVNLIHWAYHRIWMVRMLDHHRLSTQSAKHPKKIIQRMNRQQRLNQNVCQPIQVSEFAINNIYAHSLTNLWFEFPETKTKTIIFIEKRKEPPDADTKPSSSSVDGSNKGGKRTRRQLVFYLCSNLNERKRLLRKRTYHIDFGQTNLNHMFPIVSSFIFRFFSHSSSTFNFSYFVKAKKEKKIDP